MPAPRLPRDRSHGSAFWDLRERKTGAMIAVLLRSEWRIMKLHLSGPFGLLAALCGLAQASTNPATGVDAGQLLAPPSNPQAISPLLDRASTQGGQLTLSWNDDLLHDLGLDRVGAQRGGVNRDRVLRRFTLSADTRFEVDAIDLNVRGLAGGSGTLLAREQFRFDGQRIDWNQPGLSVRPGAEPRIDLRNGKGEVLFYIDKIMYEFVDQGRTFRIRSADIVISALLAEKLGRPQIADLAVGEIKLLAPVENWIAAKAIRAAGAPYWPGDPVTDQADAPPGAVWQADVFMKSFTGAVMRCGICDANNQNCSAVGCDGPAGAALGKVVFAPSSTLTNNRNRGSLLATVNDPLGTSSALYGADVPWYDKFTSSPTNNANFDYPYLNFDQHPNLIWNLYRRDADGSITQVGRSGMKHAFLTTNQNPTSPDDSCGTENGSHVLGRACQDTYGTSNNDASGDLGPKSELIAGFGVWGRCGSVFDADCNGSESPPSGAFGNRMLVDEADLPAATGGISYLFESWYIVRDDINIYNTMANRGVVPSWTGSNWAINNSGDPFALGPAIDRWLPAGTVTASAVNRELDIKRSTVAGSTAGETIYESGHSKIAVKVTDLLNGTWRYDYALMNFDYARAATTGVESNHTLRVLRNHGFNSFSVPHGAGVSILSAVYADGDVIRPDWTLVDDGSSLTWTAPSAAASLDWGVMTRFSVIANVPPVGASLTLGVSEPGTPASYSVSSLGIGTPGVLFQNGFE